jgi:hypothetical protein
MTDNTMQKLVSKQADDLFLAEKATAIRALTAKVGRDFISIGKHLKSPSFCSRSQAESPHIFCVLPLSDEFGEGIAFCGSHEKFGKCLA